MLSSSKAAQLSRVYAWTVSANSQAITESSHKLTWDASHVDSNWRACQITAKVLLSATWIDQMCGVQQRRLWHWENVKKVTNIIKISHDSPFKLKIDK